MQQSSVLSVGLPVALIIIMFGLGLSLRLEDFTRTLAEPRAVLVGLVCRIVVLPALCLGLVFATDLPPALSAGVMLLAASPSGTTATVLTHLARGDVALSITIVALSSVAAIVTLPITAHLAFAALDLESKDVSVSVQQMLQILALAVVPALVGVMIHNRYPAASSRLERPVKLLSIIFLAAVVLLALAGQWRVVATWGPVVGLTALAFNLASLFVGYFLPRLLGIDRRQAIALCMSSGIHNAALVIALALSEYMLNSPEMAIAPAVYGLIAYLTGAAAVWVLKAR